MAPLDPRAGRPRQRLTKLVRERETHCHLCGLPVDPARTGTNHPLAPTVDELVPIAHGGDPLDPDNCRLACRVCNTTRGVSPITPELRAMCLEISLMHRNAEPLRSVVVHEW
jgi:5-methylcytosine-specific restriction endonuclease McrA